MRTVAILVGLSLAFMALVPLASYNASATPETQFLFADGIISSDADIWTYGGASQAAALNPVRDEPVWGESDAAYDDDHNDGAPGCALWGNATSAIAGSYGTAEIRCTVTDIVGDEADYYTIDFKHYSQVTRGFPPSDHAGCDPEGEYLSFRLGFGYVDADTGTSEFINETYRNTSGTGSTPFETVGDPIQWLGVENGAFDRPFTASEINKLYVIMQMRFDPTAWAKIIITAPTPVNLIIQYFYLVISPTEYTPTDPQRGGFILRPNEDNHVNGFENQTVSANEGMYGALNETGQHGDAEQSYINASWDKAAFVSFGFTDPPSWAEDIDYRVTLWAIIRHTETGIGTMYSLTMSISSEGYDQKAYYPSTSYTNNTHDSDFIPGSADYWTLADLEDIIAHLWLGWAGSTPSGELRVTQLAFLCTPVVSGDYVPPPGDYEFEDVLDFFGEGNGFAIIFAVMGGIGLIATAPLMIIYYKEGRESGIGAVALGACMIAASLGFLIVGTNAWA